ncbi:hypothetical protein [Amycolatopsis sp. cmx-4-54]|uniref:hypothetical protein n=1 Tax=Amycolatopsis sp. cmx-4-54 TaxID=2790936 RepID=UPI003979DE47
MRGRGPGPPAELGFEVFGGPAADATAHALSTMPALYGWTDPLGGPPRSAYACLSPTTAANTTHPMLADPRARAVLTAH